MNLQDNYIRYLYTKGYESKTIKGKEQQLKYYLNWLTTSPLSVEETTIKNYYTYLLESKSTISITQINNYILTLKQFYSWCCTTNYIAIHPFGNFKTKQSIKSTSRIPIPTKRIQALIQVSETVEEKLLMLLGYGCGLRIGELERLQVKDVFFDKELLFIRKSKNNQSRSIPITYVILRQLERYILEEKLIKSSYFFQEKKAPSIRRIFRGLQNRLGIRPYYQIHQLRHSIASHLADNGVTIILIQQFLGHRHLKTTQNYVNLTKTIKDECITTMGRETPKESK